MVNWPWAVPLPEQISIAITYLFYPGQGDWSLSVVSGVSIIRCTERSRGVSATETGNQEKTQTKSNNHFWSLHGTSVLKVHNPSGRFRTAGESVLYHLLRVSTNLLTITIYWPKLFFISLLKSNLRDWHSHLFRLYKIQPMSGNSKSKIIGGLINYELKWYVETSVLHYSRFSLEGWAWLCDLTIGHRCCPCQKTKTFFEKGCMKGHVGARVPLCIPSVTSAAEPPTGSWPPVTLLSFSFFFFFLFSISIL